MSESTPFKIDFDSHEHPSHEHVDECPERTESCSQTRGAHRTRKSLVISVVVNVVLAICCTVLLLHGERWRLSGSSATTGSAGPLSLPGIERETEMPIRFGWEYYAATVEQMDQVDKNWDNINADAGVVSIPHTMLADAGVLQARDDPSDSSKGVLTLRAYHSLHCLKIVRRSMLELAQGQNLTIRFGHAMHCLGSLLRDTVCSADASMPLGGEGDYQYLRKCRNWSAMREWVSSRTACMRTGNDGILDMDYQDFANCSRDDGLLIP